MLMLQSMRVLDLTDEKGMLCGRILADLGADVVKIENPEGDTTCNAGPFYQDIPHPEKSLTRLALNANKRGITLNIETENGREIFKRLVKRSDVVIESFSPGYMDDLGLGYASLSELNPRIILTSITPFGQSGPYKDFKGPDLVVTALGGFLYVCGDEDRPPVRISFPQAYLHAGGQATVGTLIAYHYQQITNEGQHVELSAQQSMAWLALGVHQYLEIGKVIPRRTGPCQQVSPLVYRQMNWRCKDGYVCFGIYGGLFGLRTNVAMTEWLQEEGIAPEFMRRMDWSSFDIAKVTQDELNEMGVALEKLFGKYTKKEIYEEARKRRIMLGPMFTPKDMVEDPQLVARDFWKHVEHPELGTTIVYPGPSVQGTEISCGIRFRSPLIGEHNEEVYVKELGFKKSDLVTLKQGGVI